MLITIELIFFLFIVLLFILLFYHSHLQLKKESFQNKQLHTNLLLPPIVPVNLEFIHYQKTLPQNKIDDYFQRYMNPFRQKLSIFDILLKFQDNPECHGIILFYNDYFNLTATLYQNLIEPTNIIFLTEKNLSELVYTEENKLAVIKSYHNNNNNQSNYQSIYGNYCYKVNHLPLDNTLVIEYNKNYNSLNKTITLQQIMIICNSLDDTIGFLFQETIPGTHLYTFVLIPNTVKLANIDVQITQIPHLPNEGYYKQSYCKKTAMLSNAFVQQQYTTYYDNILRDLKRHNYYSFDRFYLFNHDIKKESNNICKHAINSEVDCFLNTKQIEHYKLAKSVGDYYIDTLGIIWEKISDCRSPFYKQCQINCQINYYTSNLTTTTTAAQAS